MAVVFENSSKKKKKNPLASIGATTNNSSSSLDNITKQTANYKTRLQASGISEQDTRNPIEKLLNLEEDQNFIFDIGEILDRPANALRGAIQEAQEGGDILEGLGKGISGKQDYYFGDILRNAGVNDEELFTNPLNDKSVSTADLLGTVGDIFLDPLNVIGVGVAGKAVKVNKAAKELSTAQDTLQGLYKTRSAIKSGDELGDMNLINNEISKAQSIVDKNKNTYNTLKTSPAPKMSLLEGIVGGTTYGVKQGAKGIDKLITKGLEKADQKKVNNLLNKGANIEDVDTLTFLSDAYKGLKQSVGRTVDYSKSAPNSLVDKVNITKNKNEATAIIEQQALSKVQKEMKEYFNKNTTKFKNIDDVDSKIRDYYDSKFYNLEKGTASTNANNSLRDFVYNNNEIKGTKDSIMSLSDKINSDDNFRKLGLTTGVKTENGISTLVFNSGKGTKNMLKKVIETPSVKKSLENIQVTRKANLSEDDIKAYKEVQNLYKTDSAFRKITDDAGNIYTENKLLKDITNNQDYSRKALNKNFKNISQGSNIKTFSEAKYGKQGVREANRNITENQQQQLAKQEKYIEKKKKTVNLDKVISKDGNITTQRIENLKTSINSSITNLKIKQDMIAVINNIEKTKPDISKLNKMILESKTGKEKKAINVYKSKIKAISNQKIADNIIDNYNEAVSNKIIKEIATIFDDKIANSYVKSIDNYNKTVNNYIDSLSKLNNNTNESIISSLYEKSEKTYQDMIKAENKLAINKAKIEGAISSKEAKNIENAVKDINKATEKRIKSQQKITEASETFKTLKESTISQISQLEKRIKEKEQLIERLDPNLNINTVKYKENLKDIQDLENLKTKNSKLVDEDYFSTSYVQGLQDYITNSVKRQTTLDTYNEVILKAGLHNEDVMKFIPKGDTLSKIPVGYVQLTNNETNKILNYLNAYKNNLPKSSQNMINDFKRMLNNSNGTVINKTAYELLNLGTKNLNEGANAVLKVVNGLNNFFKKNATFSLGFQFRNITGNVSNMWLSGIPAHSLTKEMANAQRLYSKNKMIDILEKGTKPGAKLSGKDLQDFELVKEFINAGFLGQGSKVKDLQQALKQTKDLTKYHGNIRKLYDKIFEFNMKGNEWIDATSRLAVLSYARKNPKYVAKLGVKNPVDVVKQIIFDPSKMSPFEQNVLKKAIPFYTFTKQNLMYQATNIIHNTSRYSNLLKTINKIYGSLDENQYRDYQKEQMQVPIGTDEKGNTIMLKTNLPAADLGEWVSDPIKKLISSSTPYLKTPFEIATGVDTYTGQELDRTPLETILGLTGMANMAKVPDRLMSISDENTTAQNLTNLFGSVASYNDVEKITNQNAYQEMLDYQNYINELKDNGIDVPTLQELKNQGIDVDSIRNQINGTNSLLRSIKNKRYNSYN